MAKIFRPVDNFIATTLCLIQIERSVNADKARPKFHYTKSKKCTNLFFFFSYYNITLNIPACFDICRDINCDIIIQKSEEQFFIVAPCILRSIQFTHQKMHHLLNLEKLKIYIKIHTNITPTCFGLRPLSESLY